MTTDEKPVLSPHHIGEALVAKLLTTLLNSKSLDRLMDLPVYRLLPGIQKARLRDFVPASARPIEIQANIPIQSKPKSPCLDGMHSIDCGLVFKTSQEEFVIPIELKLGQTRLSAEHFRGRFVSKAPSLTHKRTRIAGSMVSLLDQNHRRPSASQPKIVIVSQKRRVQGPWLLLLNKSTWNTWKDLGRSLSEILGTKQLMGVLVLEELATWVGLKEARQVAHDIVKKAINSWFLSKAPPE